MINVVHVITGLNVGGAERALLRLLANRTASRFNPSVISLLDKGIIGPQIQSLGVPVYPLGMKRGISGPRVLIDLRRLLKKLDPDVIQGWMYHGNLVATVAASSLGWRIPPVLWNIRHSLYEPSKERRLTRGVIYGSAWLSRLPKIIVYNSKTSASQHEAVGFKAERTRIIPNGFDCHEYYPDKKMREQVRKELEIPLNTLLIGLIARYHPMKDHSNFLRAAAELVKAEEGMRIAFLLAGRDIDLFNNPLTELIHRLGLSSKVYLLGEREDVPRLMGALDIATVASWGEGFPNVLGEAMACGIPCVATDVGDSAYLIADTGKIVPPRDSQALAAAWQKLIGIGVKGRKRLGEKARRRIAEHFNLSEIVRQYERLYLEVTP